MSLQSYVTVWEGSQAKGSTLLVLLAIAEHYNPEKGFAWPSVERIANYARVSIRTVQDHLRKLEELGELAVVVGGGRNNPSRYYLNFKKLEASRRSLAPGKNPADFAPFAPETPQNRGADSRKTLRDDVLNPAESRRESAGEGIENREPEELRESAPASTSRPASGATCRTTPTGGGSLSLPHSGLDPSDRELVLFNLAKVFPHAVGHLSPVEEAALETHFPALTEANENDWKAFRVWVNHADDKARGCRLWPANRSQALQNAGEALEKVRQWWEDRGRDWWEKRQAIAAKRAARQAEAEKIAEESPTDQPAADEEAFASREEMIAFFNS